MNNRYWVESYAEFSALNTRTRGFSLYDVPAWPFCPSGEGLLQVPSPAQTRLVVTREKIFSIVAPLLWSLPLREDLLLCHYASAGDALGWSDMDGLSVLPC